MSDPDPASFPASGVVVVEAAGDLIEVVALHPHPQLPDRLHQPRVCVPTRPGEARVQHLVQVWNQEINRRRSS